VVLRASASSLTVLEVSAGSQSATTSAGSLGDTCSGRGQLHLVISGGPEEALGVSPAALLLLRGVEDVGAELPDVVSPQTGQLAQAALQLPAASLQQVPEPPVVTLDLVPFVLVPPGAALKPLGLLLGAQQNLLI